MLFPIYQKQQYKIKKAYTISCFRWRTIQVIYNYDPDKRRAQSSDEAAFFKTKFFFCAQKNRPWRVPVTQWTHDPYMFFFMWRGCVAIDIYQVTRYVASGILLHNYSIPQSIWAISFSTCPSLLCWPKCEEKISRQLQNSIRITTAFNDTINDDFLKCYTTDTSSTLTAYFVPLDNWKFSETVIGKWIKFYVTTLGTSGFHLISSTFV